MSPTPPPPTSGIIATVNKITAGTMAYAPGVLQSMLAVEAAVHPSVPGVTKKEIILDAIMAGAHGAESIPIPQIQAIAGLIDLFASILNSLGIFKHHAAPVAATAKP